MNKILIFAGTVEGRHLAEYFGNHGIETYISVATEYGEALIRHGVRNKALNELHEVPKTEGIHVSAKRMTTKEMAEFIKDNEIEIVIDATHPYAAEVTVNIKEACDEQKCDYIRFVRSSQEYDGDYICVDSVDEAAKYLQNTTGNVLLSTGSKELSKYTIVDNYKERLFARVLSTQASITDCTKLGFEGKNLICMQGPFSEELNFAMLKQIDARYLVTKETGKAGGFLEKINAAKRADVKVIVVGRPFSEVGMSYYEIISYINKKFNIKAKRKVTILGIGMGAYENMTLEAVNACENADVIIGAKRMLKNMDRFNKPLFASYKTADIRDYIKEHIEYENIVVAMSGDVGFYSGTKKLVDELKEFQVNILSGISSVVYFCSKLKMSWDDAKLVSIHGRNENVIGAVKNNPKVFSLLGGKDCIKEFCGELIRYNLSDVTVHVGEQLSYADEKITSGTPQELIDKEFAELCVVIVENKSANRRVTHGIPDEEFIRGKVPMTKEEIRSISLSKLHLNHDSVIYDVGAGTGSVSIEMAAQAVDGIVYAIEKKPEALDLIRQNQEKMGIVNLVRIEGLAPEAMEELPPPTHAFIGGSSGNMKEIIELLLDKNPSVRIVINAIALETVAETLNCIKTLDVTDVDIAQVSVGKSKTLGKYHMMMGENPIYIISCTGCRENNKLYALRENLLS